MAREYFCAYHSYLKSVEPLNDAERGRLFVACLEYSMTGEAPDLRGNERFVFPMMKEQIDRDSKKYTDFCKKQSENIRKRWSAAEQKVDTTVYVGISGIPDDTKNTKEKEKEKEKESNTPPLSPPKTQFGEFVRLTNEEHAKLVSAHGEQATARMIEILDNYKGQSGKKYKSDYRAILNWVVERYKQESQNTPQGLPNYDADDEGVFVWTN